MADEKQVEENNIIEEKTNFEKVEQIIEDYKKLRLKAKEKNAFNLHGKLAKLGYTEDSFRLERDQNTISNMSIDVKEVDFADIAMEVPKAIEAKGNTCLLITQDYTGVYVGTDALNEKYCNDNNIPKNIIEYGGGSIVVGKDDLTLGIILNNDSLMCYFLNKLKEWINANYSPLNIVKNDLMINDGKVVGTALKDCGNGKFLYCIQVSFSVDLELVQTITMKEAKKIPTGLNSFGAKTKEDLIKEIKLWLQ